jgi:hypothetical protein
MLSGLINSKWLFFHDVPCTYVSGRFTILSGEKSNIMSTHMHLVNRPSTLCGQWSHLYRSTLYGQVLGFKYLHMTCIVQYATIQTWCTPIGLHNTYITYSVPIHSIQAEHEKRYQKPRVDSWGHFGNVFRVHPV